MVRARLLVSVVKLSVEWGSGREEGRMHDVNTSMN